MTINQTWKLEIKRERERGGEGEGEREQSHENNFQVKWWFTTHATSTIVLQSFPTLTDTFNPGPNPTPNQLYP